MAYSSRILAGFKITTVRYPTYGLPSIKRPITQYCDIPVKY